MNQSLYIFFRFVCFSANAFYEKYNIGNCVLCLKIKRIFILWVIYLFSIIFLQKTYIFNLNTFRFIYILIVCVNIKSVYIKLFILFMGRGCQL